MGSCIHFEGQYEQVSLLLDTGVMSGLTSESDIWWPMLVAAIASMECARQQCAEGADFPCCAMSSACMIYQTSELCLMSFA